MSRAKTIACAIGAMLLASVGNAAAAEARAEYERRSAERYVSLFQALDRDRDGVVARGEAQGDLNFVPRFDDMDVNRDGTVTAAELQRFVEQEYGVRVSVGSR
jgi:Ca2+-binding EF-hand superfamily protein